jgi:hypothetical protein
MISSPARKSAKLLEDALPYVCLEWGDFASGIELPMVAHTHSHSRIDILGSAGESAT